MDTKHAKGPIYVINVELIAALIRESMFSQGWTIKDLCQILCLNSCTTPCTYSHHFSGGCFKRFHETLLRGIKHKSLFYMANSADL